jgi:hypothetical protein
MQHSFILARMDPTAIPRLTTILFLNLIICSLMGAVFSAEPVKLATDLPADGIYPQGRKLAFAGYSGDPARDLANGFTLAGPVCGDQQSYLERCSGARRSNEPGSSGTTPTANVPGS